MLILAHAHSLGVDLYQFGQRVLQAAGNAHGAAQVHVKLGELRRGQRAGGVHAGPRLADHHILHPAADLADHLGGELLGFGPGGAVADGDDLHTVLLNEVFHRGLGLLHLFEGGNGIDHIGGQHLAGGVHHRQLAAHAVAGVHTQGHLAPDGRLKQQLAQVLAEHRNGPLGGPGGQLRAQFPLQAGVQQPVVGVLGGQRHLGGAGAAPGPHKAAAQQGGSLLGLRLNAHLQKAFPFAPIHRQNAVPGHLAHRFGIVVVLLVDGFLFCIGRFAGQQGGALIQFPQLLAQGGIVAELLRQNVPGTGQGGGGVRHLLAQVFGGRLLRVGAAVLGQQQLGQRGQAPGAGHAGAGLALGPVRAVQIFQTGQGFGGLQLLRQLLGQGALLFDGALHLVPALLQTAQIVQPFTQLAQHLVVHAAGGLLAVPGNEGNGVSLVDQVDGGLHGLFVQAQLLGNGFDMVHRFSL